MESAARAMLRRLASGVRPAGEVAPVQRAPFEGVGFDELVGMARAGAISSGRALRLAADLDPIDRPIMALLSAVTDAAQAGGFSRVAALIEGDPHEDETDGDALLAVYTIEVDGRVVESVTEDASGRLLTGAEAYVRVPRVSEQELREMLSEQAGAARRNRAGAPMLGAAPLRNASLARALGGE